MKRMILEQQMADEMKRMILEQGNEENHEEGYSSHSNHPQWDAMKDSIAGNAMSFASGFLDFLVKTVIVLFVILGIALFFIFR